mgnify:CR=1 FL=1
MSDKVRTSVSLTEENKRYLDTETNNRSAFINDLIDAHRRGTSDMNDIVARFRKEQLESERRSAEKTLNRVESELESLEERLDKQEAEKERTLQKARENLDGVARDPENPAIVNWATKLDMTPEQLLEEL